MRVPRRGLGRLLASLSLLAGMAGPNAASAAPPEGCVGFPDIPQAFICVTQWSPGNAVPAVSPGPGQTFVIPTFCVFQCFGPTPVTVPNVVVTSGSGLIAVITYNGAAYPIVVPPAASMEDVVAEAQQEISNALATAVGTADGARRHVAQQADGVVAAVNDVTVDGPGAALALHGTISFDCFGCGSSNASIAGTALGVKRGDLVSGAISGTATLLAPAGLLCMVSPPVLTGGIVLPDGSRLEFALIGVAGIVVYRDAIEGAGVAALTFTDPVGSPCGGPATASFSATATGT